MHHPQTFVARVGAAVALIATVAGCAHRQLPVRDQVAIYTLALRLAAEPYQRPDLTFRFLLSPLPVPLAAASARPATGRDTVPAGDTAVIQSLVRSATVAGLCAPARQDRECANGQRGLAARLSPIDWVSRDHVRVTVRVQAMRAVGDNTVLLDEPLTRTFEFVHIDGHWELPPHTAARPT
jgi:hypothetical protein